MEARKYTRTKLTHFGMCAFGRGGTAYRAGTGPLVYTAGSGTTVSITLVDWRSLAGCDVGVSSGTSCRQGEHPDCDEYLGGQRE
jgi:hypothetical protein